MHISFRLQPEQQQKFYQLRERTGMSTSQLLRSLVENAEMRPVTRVRPVAYVPTKSEDTGESLAAEPVSSRSIE